MNCKFKGKKLINKNKYCTVGLSQRMLDVNLFHIFHTKLAFTGTTNSTDVSTKSIKLTKQLTCPMMTINSARTNLNRLVASLLSNSRAGARFRLGTRMLSPAALPTFVLREISFLTSVSNAWKSMERRATRKLTWNFLF
jgi:hypothetical protein